MKLCGGLVPHLTGAIVLLLLNFGKVVQAHCSNKTFYYKLPNSHNDCGLCRICPREVVDSHQLYEKHLQEECQHLPALPDGRLPHCHSTSFDKPSCEKWAPHNGRAVCSNGNTVYSTCFLQCNVGYRPSNSTNITCTDRPQPKWDRHFTHCTGGGTGLDTVAVVFIVIVIVAAAVLGVVVIFICVKKKSSTDADIDIEEQVAPPAVRNVRITLANATQRCYKLHKWSAKRGSTVTVMAYSKGCGIQYLVLLKRESKTGDPAVYSSKPNGPSQVDLVSLDYSHQGSYNWIVQLTDGTTERGHFKLVVKKHMFPVRSIYAGLCPSGNIPVAVQCSAGQPSTSPKCEADNILSHTQPAVEENSLQAVPDTSLVLVTTATEDLEQMPEPQPVRDKMEGYSRLMQTRQDVRTLCRLLDREEQDGHVSWHVIVTSPLLGYDRDFLSFLEYHRKGRMYDGPMCHVLNLMKQNGTTVEELIELLQQYQPSSNKAIAVLEKYL
ncbi:uncharacterized protein LOC124117491 isoform X1 [Haliotis rufescens]|uniref:uncharacterized protein LOC124117491 isoform X1 n=1 Tax=Haliotis rufescens TaxID=6454 RepID=UPI00201EAC71|nr:uncharacterized protein LOC124117491 isoform X1 [Haliotis rufescens]